jgi:hypothetical protein
MCYIKHPTRFNVDNNKDNNIYINIHELELDNEIIPELITNEDDSFLHIFEVSVCLFTLYYVVFSNLDFIFTSLGLV